MRAENICVATSVKIIGYEITVWPYVSWKEAAL